MSKQSEITREQLEEIVVEAVRDYMPGRSASKFVDFFRGKGGRFRQDGGEGEGDPFGRRKKKSTDTDAGDKEAPSGEKVKAGDSGEEQDSAGYPGTEEGGEEKKSALPKDTPVSVMKKQKDVVVGQGGQKEAPLVMHIQKMGVSQSTAQAIAKRSTPEQ